MKLSERISLIKAGYSKKEIAEIEAKENEPEQEPETQPEQEPETQPEQEPEQEQNNIITDLKAQITALKALVEGIQQDNINRDQGDKLPEDKTGDDILNEVIY